MKINMIENVRNKYFEECTCIPSLSESYLGIDSMLCY